MKPTKKHSVTVTGMYGTWRGVVEAKESRATVAKRIAEAFGVDGRTIDRKGFVRVLSRELAPSARWANVEVG